MYCNRMCINLHALVGLGTLCVVISKWCFSYKSCYSKNVLSMVHSLMVTLSKETHLLLPEKMDLASVIDCCATLLVVIVLQCTQQ